MELTLSEKNKTLVLKKSFTSFLFKKLFKNIKHKGAKKIFVEPFLKWARCVL